MSDQRRSEAIADQRYYHFVGLRTASAVAELDDYWRLLEWTRVPREPVTFHGDQVTLEHRKVASTRLYARGALAEQAVGMRNRQGKYEYDQFGALVRTEGGATFLAIGFPYVGLATEIGLERLGAHGESPLGKFVAIDIPKLVGALERGMPRIASPDVHAVGLRVSVRDDKSLTAVRLGGDQPLEAALYREYLRPRIAQGALVPDQCVLSCERVGGARTLRSRIHLDRHGNLRFYAHVACANLELIGTVFDYLDKAGCLSDAVRNPLLRMEADQEGGL